MEEGGRKEGRKEKDIISSYPNRQGGIQAGTANLPNSRSRRQVWQTFLSLAQIWQTSVFLNRALAPGLQRKTVKGRAQT